MKNFSNRPKFFATAIASARLWAKLAGDPDPAGPATGRVLAGFRRRSAGRSQAAASTAAMLAAIFATAGRPRRAGRGLESAEWAAVFGVDQVIAGLLLMAGLRRLEATALEWRDVTDAREEGDLLVAVRRSLNPESRDERRRAEARASCELAFTVRVHRLERHALEAKRRRAAFTRYARVLDAAGKPMSVRAALALMNQTLDEVLAEQEGDFDADSRWALAWFEQHGFDGDYGVAETLSKAKNTSVAGMVGAGIIESQGGKVRLLRPKELPDDWDPAADARLTAWEAVHHLIRILETHGETGTDPAPFTCLDRTIPPPPGDIGFSLINRVIGCLTSDRSFPA